MLPRITIIRTWSDKDVAQLAIEVCDGVSVFTNEAYASLEWGAAAAAALRRFGSQIHGGLFDLEAGDGGPECASGSFRARFRLGSEKHRRRGRHLAALEAEEVSLLDRRDE